MSFRTDPSRYPIVKVYPHTSSDFDILSVELNDATDVTLDADCEGVEFVLQNETGFDVLWGKVNAPTHANGVATSVMVCHNLDVAGLPFSNLNMVKARLAPASGTATVHILVRYA
jgi:hypothetical protein